MIRNMKRGLSIVILLACVLLCAACSEKEPSQKEPTPESNQTQDYSGTYTDKQGTDEIYSSLTLRSNSDGTYAAEVGIYRVTTLEGTVDDALHFTSDTSNGPDVKGDIVIDGGIAEMTITESDFSELAAGTVVRFPDGKES